MTCFRLCAATAPRGSSNGTAREDDVDLLKNGEKEERQGLLVCKVTVIEKIMSSTASLLGRGPTYVCRCENYACVVTHE